MSAPVNGSFDHLIGQLDRRLARIEVSLDKVIEHVDDKHEKLNGRVVDLEKRNANVAGGWKAVGIIGGIAGTVGGVVAKWLTGGLN